MENEAAGVGAAAPALPIRRRPIVVSVVVAYFVVAGVVFGGLGLGLLIPHSASAAWFLLGAIPSFGVAHGLAKGRPWARVAAWAGLWVWAASVALRFPRDVAMNVESSLAALAVGSLLMLPSAKAWFGRPLASSAAPSPS
ncbi:MAG: hypothetical protein V4510_11515 [bacterium]